MSADLLREAAEAIRGDRPFATTDEGDFMFAVAEWLDREAALHDTLSAASELLQTAARGLGASEMRLQFSKDSSGVAMSTMPQALAVARAYLGRDA